MKRLLISAVFVFLCIVCFSCNTRPQVDTVGPLESETTDLSMQSTTTEYMESDSFTYVIPAETQPENLNLNLGKVITLETPILYIMPSLDWIGRLPVKLIEEDIWKICMEVPNCWIDIQLENIPLLDSPYLFEIDHNAVMNANLIYSLVGGYKSAKDRDCFITGNTQKNLEYIVFYESYSDADSMYKYVYECFIRVSENYIWQFMLRSTEQDYSTALIDAINTICLVGPGPSYSMIPEQNNENNESRVITIEDLNIKNDNPNTTFDVNLEIEIPEQWSLISETSDIIIFALNSKPEAAISGNTVYCPYPALNISLHADQILDDIKSNEEYYYQCFPDQLYRYDETFMGITESGNSYLLYSHTIEDYHTVKIQACVQLPENYIISFILYIDIDEMDLVYDIINSLSISDKKI